MRRRPGALLIVLTCLSLWGIGEVARLLFVHSHRGSAFWFAFALVCAIVLGLLATTLRRWRKLLGAD